MQPTLMLFIELRVSKTTKGQYVSKGDDPGSGVTQCGAVVMEVS